MTPLGADATVEQRIVESGLSTSLAPTEPFEAFGKMDGDRSFHADIAFYEVVLSYGPDDGSEIPLSADECVHRHQSAGVRPRVSRATAETLRGLDDHRCPGRSSVGLRTAASQLRRACADPRPHPLGAGHLRHTRRGEAPFRREPAGSLVGRPDLRPGPGLLRQARRSGGRASVARREAGARAESRASTASPTTSSRSSTPREATRRRPSAI